MTSILLLEGMRSVHSVRAVFTALGAVPGIQRAHVTIGRAEVEHDLPLERATLSDALQLAGCTLTRVQAERRLNIRDDG